MTNAFEDALWRELERIADRASVQPADQPADAPAVSVEFLQRRLAELNERFSHPLTKTAIVSLGGRVAEIEHLLAACGHPVESPFSG